MMIYVLPFLLLLLIAWIVALNVDAKFFNGKFLIKAKTTSEELREELEKALESKRRPFDDWDESTLYWLHDFFLLVLIFDSDLEKIRKSIVESLELHSEKEYLHPDTIVLIENAVKKLS